MSNGNQDFSLLRFFGRPAVGIAGSIASIVGIALSAYFYLAAQERPALTYFVHPAKAAVVRTDHTSRLAVQFDGQDVTGNVTAAQVAFWNAGNKPIRANSILSPLVLRTGDETRILEVQLRKTSRDVVQITLETSRLEEGEVEIGWNILEQDDGGVLQLVIAGDEMVEIQAHAVVEGQAEIVEIKSAQEVSSSDERYAEMQSTFRLISYVYITMGVFLLPMGLWILVSRRKSGRSPRYLHWVTLGLGPVTIVVGVWLLFTQTATGPPFGF